MDLTCGFLRDYVPTRGDETVVLSHVENCEDCLVESGLADAS